MASKPPTTRSSGRCPAVAEDRLSSLQDGLLHTILSFLPARQAVQTCALSRRWRNLWRSTPCLHIDQREFDGAASSGDRGGRFVEFVDTLLTLHGASSLDRFRCHVTHGYEFGVVERWIRHGIKCSPAVMEVSWSSGAFFFGLLPHPAGSTGCRLRRLHLAGIALDTGFARGLRSGCPVMEDLHLERCLLDSPEITSHTLKSLVVTDCTSYFGTVLMITAPALASFHLAITSTGSNWRGIVVNEMPCLVKASIRSESPVASCKLLCNLVNVGTLELSGSKTLSILHKGPNAFPTFCNLKTLLFDGCNLNNDFKIFGCFLNNAPSLEKLTLHHCVLPGLYRKRKRMAHAHPMQISSEYPDKLTLQCAKLKWTEIKNKLSGIWSNLQNSSITVNKV